MGYSGVLAWIVMMFMSGRGAGGPGGGGGLGLGLGRDPCTVLRVCQTQGVV